MAITNPKLFGLNVLTYLADVENRNAALRSLDLNILELFPTPLIFPSSFVLKSL